MQKIKKLNRKKVRLILIILAFIFVIAAAFYTVFIKPTLSEEKWIYMESTVQQGDLTVGVTESGTLSYGITSQLYELDLSTDDEDEDDDEDDEDDEEEETIKYLQVEEVYVATGQRISEGEKIMKFTSESVEAVRRKLVNATTEAEVALAEAKSEYNVEVISAKKTYGLSEAQSSSASGTYNLTVQTAQNQIAQNQIEIQKLQDEIVLNQGKIEDAKEDYDDALEDYEDAKAALEAVGNVNQIVTIKFENSYLQAKSSYERAKESLEKIYETIEEDQKEIAELQTEIETASAKLAVDQLEAKQSYDSAVATGSVAGTTYEATLASLQTTVDKAQEDLDIMSDKLEDFEEFVGDGTVYAEGDGIVTTVGFEEGDYLQEADTVVAFATEDDMTISVDVSQEDVVALSVGDPVEIVFSAYEEEIYAGIIDSITTTNVSSNSTTVSYSVTILVQGDTSALYGGMTADVTFVTEQHTDTLYISKKAIVTENDVDYVYVEKNGKYELQEIETGLSNGSSVEILDGLSAGDVIYIASKISSTAEDEDGSESLETEESSDNTGGFPMQNEGGMPNMESMPNDAPGGEMPGGPMGGMQ